jgi:ketosteroid isomerase-like protein
MRLFLRFRVPALLLLLFACSSSIFAADAGAKTVDDAWVKAMKANNLEGVLACYAPDAVAWLPDTPEANGEKAIRAAYEGLLNANTVQDVTVTDSHYKTSGNLSVGWGRFSLTLAPKSGGAVVVMRGRFAEAAELRGGRWVYIVDHASAEPIPSQPMK